jgi:hypothetical protein
LIIAADLLKKLKLWRNQERAGAALSSRKRGINSGKNL